MKQPIRTFALRVLLSVGPLFVGPQAQAQHGVPLTLQGLNHASMHSAASRGLGGITLTVTNDISLMFANPALLLRADGIQLSVGGIRRSIFMKQDQEYGALQNYADFQFLMMSTTSQISIDTAKINAKLRSGKTLTQADSVQRPFGADSLTLPGWRRDVSGTAPVQAFLTVPFTIGGVKIVTGIGIAEYANLDWYYQNNNTLSPNVLDVATNGVIRTGTLPAADSTIAIVGPPYLVQWYRSIQRRSGSILGYGGSIAAALSEKLSLGASAMIVSGTVDDYEENVGRGQIAFYANSLRLSQHGKTHSIATGTSEFSGLELTLSALYELKNARIGFSVKPPSTITRRYEGSRWADSVAAVKRYDSRIDSVHVIGTTAYRGEDKMALPWRGTAGIGIQLRDDLTMGLEYEIRAFANATYTNAIGAESQPWLSSTVIRCGLEYQPASWLRLRTGVRQDAEVFQAATNALRGEVVRYPVYSLGLGLAISDIRLNVAYEYADSRYVDTWSNAAHTNVQNVNTLVANVSYTLPFGID